MSYTIRKYIRKISAGNLIFPGIAAIILLLVLILTPMKQAFDPPKASDLNEVFELRNQKYNYVDLSLTNLTYTNYDHYAGKDNVSCYYYILDEGEDPKCLFVLIPYEYTNDRAENIGIYTAKARFVDGDARFDTFLTGFSSDIGWNTAALSAISGHFMVSQSDFRPVLIFAALAILAALCLVCLIYFLANIVFIIAPHLHPSCRRLKRFGLDGKDFTEIDRELAEALLFKAGRTHITENYLVVFGKRSIWMVPLFNIVWAYKYSNWNPFVRKKKLSYSLVVITSPKDKISIGGQKKSDADKVLNFFEENFSHITVGYTDEIREKMEKLI